MADEVAETAYQLVTEAGETLTTSRGFNGRGTATYPGGDTYEGQFNEGVRHGEGVYKYVPKGEDQQDIYKGQWENNVKCGVGKQTYFGVGEYYGNWLNGERHGEGVMTYSNKDVYSGKWREGKKDGEGTYIFFETGMKYVGTFKNG